MKKSDNFADKHRNWKSLSLAVDGTIKDAICILDKESQKIVLIIDNDDKLIGTVTDGDIRRGILNKIGLNNCITDVMQKSPLYAYDTDSDDFVTVLMKKNGIYNIPILDSSDTVVGLKTLKNGKKDNVIFIMAGGFGKRLLPLTSKTPNPLLSVGGKPILERVIEGFIKAGFYNFYISVHYKAEMLKEYFEDGSKWGVSIKYINENKPLGTAGSLGLLPKDEVSNLPIIITNGDLITELDYESLLDFHKEHNSKATMCVREYDYQVPYGIVNIEEYKLKSIVEKPVHRFFINAGIYVIESSIVNTLKVNSYIDMTTLIDSQIEKGERVMTFPLHEYWIDIGLVKEFNKANRKFGS